MCIRDSCLKARDCSTFSSTSRTAVAGLYLKLAFIDDATVHRMYSELPGGYVMLSDGV